MAYILKTDGTKIPLQGEIDGKLSAKQLHDAVNGYIEIVRTDDGQFMVLNEEGKLQGLPFNLNATKMAYATVRDSIVGDVVICGQGEID